MHGSDYCTGSSLTKGCHPEAEPKDLRLFLSADYLRALDRIDFLNATADPSSLRSSG